MAARRFQRPVSRVIVDLVGALIGATAFLGVAGALAIGLFDIDPLGRLVAIAGFGLFGLLMATAVPNGIRRGLNRTILEVGPDGLWTPEMGRLAWSEIADVRIEQVRGFAGGDHDPDDFPREQIPMTTYTRLGIVPTDPNRTARERRRLGWRITDWMGRVSRSVNPSSPPQDLSVLAPFGVYAYEVDGPLGDVVEAIRPYRAVGLP
jgi:hypothetical protein